MTSKRLNVPPTLQVPVPNFPLSSPISEEISSPSCSSAEDREDRELERHRPFDFLVKATRQKIERSSKDGSGGKDGGNTDAESSSRLSLGGKKKKTTKPVGLNLVTSFASAISAKPAKPAQNPPVEAKTAPFVDLNDLKQLSKAREKERTAQKPAPKAPSLQKEKSKTLWKDSSKKMMPRSFLNLDTDSEESINGPGTFLSSSAENVSNDRPDHGFSPSDRNVMIGLMVPQNESSDRSREFDHAADQYTPLTPSIIVTPACEEAPWSIDTSSPEGLRPRVTSSVYSQPTPRLWSDDSDIPPVPAIPEEHHHYLVKGHNADFLDAHFAAMTRKRRSLSAGAVLEHDSPASEQPRSMVDDDDQNPLNRLSVNSEASRPASQGWWNVLLSPLLGRSNTLSSKKSPTSASFRSPLPSPSVVPSALGTNRHWWERGKEKETSCFSPDTPDTVATSMWQDGRRSMEQSRSPNAQNMDEVPPMPNRDNAMSMMFPGNRIQGEAAEYFQACAHELFSKRPYFECVNHTCSITPPDVVAARLEAQNVITGDRGLVLDGTETHKTDSLIKGADAATTKEGLLIDVDSPTEETAKETLCVKCSHRRGSTASTDSWASTAVDTIDGDNEKNEKSLPELPKDMEKEIDAESPVQPAHAQPLSRQIVETAVQPPVQGPVSIPPAYVAVEPPAPAPVPEPLPPAPAPYAPPEPFIREAEPAPPPPAPPAAYYPEPPVPPPAPAPYVPPEPLIREIEQPPAPYIPPEPPAPEPQPYVPPPPPNYQPEPFSEPPPAPTPQPQIINNYYHYGVPPPPEPPIAPPAEDRSITSGYPANSSSNPFLPPQNQHQPQYQQVQKQPDQEISEWPWTPPVPQPYSKEPAQEADVVKVPEEFREIPNEHSREPPQEADIVKVPAEFQDRPHESGPEMERSAPHLGLSENHGAPQTSEPISPGFQRAAGGPRSIQLSEVNAPAPVYGQHTRDMPLPMRYDLHPAPGAAVMNPTGEAGPGEAQRRRLEREDAVGKKIGGLWRGRGCFSKAGCFGRPGREGRLRRRWYLAIFIFFLIIIIIAISLATTLTRKRGDLTSVQSQWVNLTNYPPVQTGIMTITGTETQDANSACVTIEKLWSCALPKGSQQTENKPYDADEPTFRIEIQYRNSSSSDSNSTDTSSSNSTTTKRGTWTADPSPPSMADQIFIGNTTDGNSKPYAGEETPFYISVLSPAHLSSTNVFRRSTSSNSSSSINSSSVIPAPTENSDGTAAAATLYPLPSTQPLRLYNRGESSEHYGFYTYFDKSIFTQSRAPLNGSSVDYDPEDDDGGSTEADAKARCTFSQTRFLVQIWTNPSGMGYSLSLIWFYVNCYFYSIYYHQNFIYVYIFNSDFVFIGNGLYTSWVLCIPCYHYGRSTWWRCR
ncbi:uncharacterized protein N7483_004120 [Penicillium malachiteum]|uniref:uncharacterized protein n=1 Tax=Penicillium malachiteum TaxID=1324776 RepID=UPI0025470DF8|nr:uncharacterized protein N7483_004120 [Penicillium malachiteum]KAJ5729612.1 hypothetical protein N7483_004120 [Penicillium malachiteum]